MINRKMFIRPVTMMSEPHNMRYLFTNSFDRCLSSKTTNHRSSDKISSMNMRRKRNFPHWVAQKVNHRPYFIDGYVRIFLCHTFTFLKVS